MVLYAKIAYHRGLSPPLASQMIIHYRARAGDALGAHSHMKSRGRIRIYGAAREGTAGTQCTLLF